MSPFFIRQKVRSVRIGVYVVEAPSKEIADKLTLRDEDYTGYYTDDGKDVEKPVGETAGPFETAEEACMSEAGWIEDVG